MDHIEMDGMSAKVSTLSVSRSHSTQSRHYHRHNDEEQNIIADRGDGSAKTTSTEQMKRNFGSLSTLALSITLLASWESIASNFRPALLNGGPAALVWGLLLSTSGSLAMAMSLAEMASICPISGAQYHWTALFAPPRIRHFMTWMQGWITVFAWQAAAASTIYTVALQLQALIMFNVEDYGTPPRWHGTLFVWGMTAFCFAVNVTAIKILPVIQVLGGICHVTFFVALTIPLILLGRRSTPDFVFRTVQSNGGYENHGISFCVGLLTAAYAFLGFDGAVHLAEEVRNPKRVIPKILVQTILINGGLAMAFALVLLFFIDNVEEALKSNTNFPIIIIFYNATKSKVAATVMQAAITSVGTASIIGVVASVSRLTWAFARDGGLPFPKFFAHVDGRFHVPFRAIGLVSLTVLLLSLIKIASAEAFSALLSLTTLSLYVSYLIPIVLLVLKRLRPPSSTALNLFETHTSLLTAENLANAEIPLVFGPWSLGRWGIWINLYAIAFGAMVCFFVPWPKTVPVKVDEMNYAGPVFAGVLILLMIDWTVRARKRYVGPVKLLLEISRKGDRVDLEERDGTRRGSRSAARETWGRAKY